jgi:hypothetical protein
MYIIDFMKFWKDKKLVLAWYQWLIPVILATQEAEIRRVV